MYGPFSCGFWLDIRILLDKIPNYLQSGENVIADKGYELHGYILLGTVHSNLRLMHGKIRERQETCNKRFESLFILRKLFRHNVKLHSRVIHFVSKNCVFSDFTGRTAL